MRLLPPLICALVLLRRSAAAGELVPTDAGSPSPRGYTGRNQRPAPDAAPAPNHGADLVDAGRRHHGFSSSAFNLHVVVSDALSRRYLSQAAVDVYVNYTRSNTALTGDDGAVLLHVPYQAGLPVVVVASKHGYICSPLCLNTRTKLIFSSVTISLLGLNQGNIWLFEDSIVITGRTSDASSQPVVRFAKSLLNLTALSDMTSVKAYLSLPKVPSDADSLTDTLAIMSHTSGYVSVELRPVAAVSVQLFSANTELHVSGPIMISLRVTNNCGLQSTDAVPAWFFNQTTGAWMRKGLGSVASVDGQLLWTFTAPHLGYWIAAPLPSTRGLLGLTVPTDDFISQLPSLLMLLLGGSLLLVVCLLAALGRCHRRSTAQIPPVTRKDQTTCTCDEEACDLSSGHVSYAQNGLKRPLTEGGGGEHTASLVPLHNGSVIANPGAVAVTLESDDQEASADPGDLRRLHQTSEQVRAAAGLAENLFFFNQPVAVLHAPAFFHLEEQPDQHLGSKSATLPRAGASNNADAEPGNKDDSTQTLPVSEAAGLGDQLGVLQSAQAASSTNASRAHFGLPESMSVPGRLNKIRESRHSVNALADLTKVPSAQTPRAWFVSLEGKPAAEIHYAVSEQQRRRRPAGSPETSLDSGVDMSELNQVSARRVVTLERNASFVKSSVGSKHTPPQ